MNINSKNRDSKLNLLFQLAALATDTIWLLATFGIGIASIYFLADGAQTLLGYVSSPITLATDSARFFYGATFFAMLCLVAVNLILLNLKYNLYREKHLNFLNFNSSSLLSCVVCNIYVWSFMT